MKPLQVETRTFKGVEFEVQNAPDRPMYVVLGIRKSGSSIFNNICAALAERNNVKFVDVGGALFEAGVRVSDWTDDAGIEEILAPGNLYGGFRNFPTALTRTEAFKAAPKVLMVRDPRDVLVSEYFSNAYSHSLPEGGEGREDFAAERARAQGSELHEYISGRVKPLVETCRPFLSLLGDPNLKVFRYEDVILRKRVLIRGVVDHFGWHATKEFVDQIMGWADVRPDAERPTEFIRRVTPGDYQEKMSPDLQSRVRAELGDFFEAFDYG